MTRHRARATIVVALCLLAVPAAAGAAGIELPDGRFGADVSVEPNVEGDGGEARVRTTVGALGTDNSLRGEASPEDGDDPYPRLTNPPMLGAVGGNERGVHFEELYGPPTAHAALGTGGLTAGFGDAGVLTNLAWPGPGSPDHVSYAHITRGYPNQGAAENMGSFGGLLLPDGTAIDGHRVIWFSPEQGWTLRSQAYEGPRSGVLRTVLQRDGIEVTIRDVVHPTLDVLARSIEVIGAPSGARVVYFSNMDPTTGRVPRVPANVSGATDAGEDFGTAYDAGRGVMVAFRPYTIDLAAATVAITGELSVERTSEALARTFGPGVYLAMGGDELPSGHQAGLDSGGLLRDEAEGTIALDPYYDARDGELSGSDLAFGRTSGALSWSSTATTVYLTAADDATAAADAVTSARALGFEGIRTAAEADWADWTSSTRLPAVSDPQTLAVSERALMIIRTAQDRHTGAIVANTTSQTPYKQDWLRDGAFFNYALMLAGHPEMVAAHNDFYRRAQSATGVWDPILCTDGAQCSAVFPFEIDAQAFGVWALWLEYDLSERDAAALDRLRTGYEAIRKGAEVLYACQDPLTDLQCYASEDDTVNPTQGAQGASTVYLGLRSAASAARLVGSAADAERWDARADALRTAARARLCSTTCETGRGYMIWPGKVLTDPTPHPALQATLDAMWRPFPSRLAGTGPGYGEALQYPMEPLFSLATTGWRTAHEGDLADAVTWLTHHLAAPGVLHYAERMYHLGGFRYLYTVGYPHIWSGAEVYIAAALISGIADCPPGRATLGDAACS